jgi:ribosome biogenesis GTPase / thiamine phosphate phosphatase
MEDSTLTTMGYREWLQQVGDQSIPDGFSPARVTEVNKNSYRVSDGTHEMPAELSGRFLFEVEDTTGYPTVGDWVVIQPLDNNTFAVIHSVLPRRTLLKRKESGKRVEFQLIAANIDVGLVVQSAENPRFNLLDRYLVMLHESGIEPVAVFSKTDLLSAAELEAFKNSLSRLGCRYLLLSNVAEKGREELTAILLPGRSYCLLGQSGVGKTSLLNGLIGSELLKVNEVRAQDGRGKHTTVRRQLIRIPSGSIFIDTPGMRELGTFESDQGMDETFDDIASRASECRFRDCTHMHEAGCAVIAAVDAGAIDGERYRNFLKLRKETQFYDMSRQEKRRKDRSFGKMLKNYKKSDPKQ